MIKSDMIRLIYLRKFWMIAAEVEKIVYLNSHSYYSHPFEVWSYFIYIYLVQVDCHFRIFIKYFVP